MTLASRKGKATTFQRTLALASVVLLLLVVDVSAKPGAAISLRSPSNYQFDPYSNAQFTLEFALPKTAVKLNMQMQTDESMTLLTPEHTQSFDLSDHQGSFSIPVVLESGAAGIYYLMFNCVLTYNNGRTEARSMGIRLQVGNTESVKQKPKNNAAREGIKELPAREVISN